MTIKQIDNMIQEAAEKWRLFEEAIGKQALIDLETLLVRRKPNAARPNS